MKNLYELIGAFPDDDAEALRDAFRNVVKATHPDVNSGDPDAPLKFRQIVRANSILSDPQQRAAYDRLLAAAEHPTRAFVAQTLRKLAADVVAVVILSAILVAGYGLYALYWPATKAALNPERAIKPVAARGAAETAVAISARAPETADPVELRDKLRDMKPLSDAMSPAGPPAVGADPAPAAPEEDAKSHQARGVAENGLPSETMWPTAGSTSTSSDGPQLAGSADPPLDRPKDAKSYRERGIAAYREGDLLRALVNFDLAIQHDPGASETYVDRGIVFYRMQQFDRAFADIAEAKRIERVAASKPLPRPLSPSGEN
jgi:curved DNA-binding protein CbpA